MQIVARYHHFIEWITAFAPAQSDKFMHTYVGLGLWLGAAIVLRRPLASRRPLQAMVAAELANELLDWLYGHGWTLKDTLGDLAATWFWPFLLASALWSMPWLGRRK